MLDHRSSPNQFNRTVLLIAQHRIDDHQCYENSAFETSIALRPEGRVRYGTSFGATSPGKAGIVLDNLKDRLLTPSRLASILPALAGRKASHAEAVDKRLCSKPPSPAKIASTAKFLA
jgi:hypothetical protein